MRLRKILIFALAIIAVILMLTSIKYFMYLSFALLSTKAVLIALILFFFFVVPK